MEIRSDDWLSSLFARPVFNVSIDQGDVPGETASRLHEHLDRQPASFYYAKVSTQDVPMVSALTAVGMRVLDVNATFSIAAADAAPPQKAGVVVREATAADAAATLDIAEREYQVTRFHLDPLMPPGLANRIKREWVGNYFAGRRGEKIWVAEVDRQVAGFLAVIGTMAGTHRIKTIDLLAVKATMRRRGIGAALVNFFLHRYAGECDRLEVGTQIANATSIRMYERAGFRLNRAQYVLHLHRP